MPLKIIDRKTKKEEIEKIYGGAFLQFLYSDNIFAKILLYLISKNSVISHIYGLINKTSFSKVKIKPFIEKFDIDTKEFVKDVNGFSSFNDFFIRELKKEARKIEGQSSDIIIPADGRILVFSSLSSDGFYIKGQKFSLNDFLQDDDLAEKYVDGSIVILRLAPVDFHRFYFPIDCLPSCGNLINGSFFSVNPIALKDRIKILWQNKRYITLLQTKSYGQIIFAEVGACNVGSIKQTFILGKNYKRADEKGYFSLGGSCIVMLFEKGKIVFADDLIQNSKKHIETKVKFGQMLGSMS